jgi:hypothetical protein
MSFAQAEIEYNNQSDPASFVSYNTEGTFGGATPAAVQENSIIEDEAL